MDYFIVAIIAFIVGGVVGYLSRKPIEKTGDSIEASVKADVTKVADGAAKSIQDAARKV
jgi:hypothetical protein